MQIVRRLPLSGHQENKREIVVLLTCLLLLRSSLYVPRCALSTKTHYQQTRYESSALLPPPDPAVNPPLQPQPPCLGCQRKSFHFPLDQQLSRFPSRFRKPFGNVSVTQNRTKLPTFLLSPGDPIIFSKVGRANSLPNRLTRDEERWKRMKRASGTCRGCEVRGGKGQFAPSPKKHA